MKKQAYEWWKAGKRQAQEAADQPELFEQWVEQLAIRDPSIMVPAMVALQQAGPMVIPTLLDGLKHQHTRVRRGCVDIIDHGGYGGDARCVEALLPLLHDPVPHIRRAVWHTLFCERCPDPAKCEVITSTELDRVALLIEIGLNDPNPRLKQQLMGDLAEHVSDQRARHALELIAHEENDSALRELAQRVLV
jgi:hypothetical protein